MDFFSPNYNPKQIIGNNIIDKTNMKLLINQIKDCNITSELHNLIYKRILQHITKDLEKRRKCLICEYITIKHVLYLLKKQQNKCHFCDVDMNLVPTHVKHMRDLDAFSIDRINNKKPHMKDNCVISCFCCNVNRDYFKGENLGNDELKNELLEFKRLTIKSRLNMPESDDDDDLIL